ncbi:MAG: class I SAM-dependent methyltransferase [Alphaproteobacteria bacterium]|nr:class I SAM-dependent methyltransferase [Alphaproteobacteria bacterium]
MALDWTSDTTATLNGVPVRVVYSGFSEVQTTDDEIIVLKPRYFFDSYRELFANTESPRSIVELGVFEGGSALILAEMFPHARIEAVDLRAANPAVLRHITRMGFADRLRIHYGVSQADEAALTELVERRLDSRVDLVVDDASHEYELTRRSLEILLPFVRPGGIYAIEDWGWAHWPAPTFDHWAGTALSSLILELVMATATRPKLFGRLVVNGSFAYLVRGADAVERPFRLVDHVKIAPRQWAPVRL